MENPVNLKLKDVKTLLLKCAVIITENNYIILFEVLLKWQIKNTFPYQQRLHILSLNYKLCSNTLLFSAYWVGEEFNAWFKVSLTCEIARLYFMSLLPLPVYMARSHHSSNKKWWATWLKNCHNNFTYSIITTYIDLSFSFLKLNTTNILI